MSRFAATLRLEVTAEDIANAESVGLSFDELTSQTQDFFRKVDLTEKPIFTAEKITDIETGNVIRDYNATVVGKFTIDDTLFIKTSMGDILAVEFYRI
jgi:hypothetical protein